MLVLTRRVGEEVVIDGSIRVVVVDIQGSRVRLGVDAPPDVRIDRLEIHVRRTNEEMPAAHDPYEVAAAAGVPALAGALSP